VVEVEVEGEVGVGVDVEAEAGGCRVGNGEQGESRAGDYCQVSENGSRTEVVQRRAESRAA
jgi:hypothetical protein